MFSLANISNLLTDGGSARMASPRATICVSVAVWGLAALCALVIFAPYDSEASEWRMHAFTASSLIGGGVAALTLGLVCKCVSRYMSPLLRLTLAISTVMLIAGQMWNMEGYCAAADSWLHPAFFDGTDIWREYTQALLAADGRYDDMWGNNGYALILGTLMRCLGTTSLLPAMLLNIPATLSAAVVTGAICRRLLPTHNKQKMQAAGTLLYLLVPSIIYYGTVPMKESLVCLGMSVSTLMLADAYMNRRSSGVILMAIFGPALLMIVKSPMCWIILLGCLFAVIHLWIQHSRLHTSIWPGTSILLYLMLMCVAGARGGESLRQTTDANMLDPDNTELMDYEMLTEKAVGKYSRVIAGYYYKSPAEKIAWLPIGAVTQYLPPFPWNFTRDSYIARTVVWAHLSLFWYIIGGLGICMAILCCFRRKRAAGLSLWCLWWWCVYLGIAYMSGGTVARYWLPMLPAFIPLSMQMLIAVRNGLVSGRAVLITGSVYIILLAGALTGAYIFLNK